MTEDRNELRIADAIQQLCRSLLYFTFFLRGKKAKYINRMRDINSQLTYRNIYPH